MSMPLSVAQHRVQVDLGHILEFGDHAGQLADGFRQRRQVDTLFAPYALEQRVSLDLADHATSFGGLHRRNPEGYVFEHFHEYAAEAEHDGRAEGRVEAAPYNALHPTGEHGRDHHAVDLRRGIVDFCVGNEPVIGFTGFFPRNPRSRRPRPHRSCAISPGTRSS